MEHRDVEIREREIVLRVEGEVLAVFGVAADVAAAGNGEAVAGGAAVEKAEIG